MKNLKLLVVCMAIILVAGSVTFAVDLLVPPWRGEEGSTFQEWHFSTDDITPVPDVVNNSYGDPLLRVNPIGDWIDVIDQHQGVWPLSGEIDLYIPNWPELRPEKEIWIQIIWKATDVGGPFLPNEPVIGVTPFESMQMSRMEDFDLGDGWVHTPFKISLYPNPPGEWITIKGNIMVDRLVIDTRCIPEPATLVLLGMGGLVVFARKRWSA